MRKLLVVIALICIGCNVVGFRSPNRQEMDEYERKHTNWVLSGGMSKFEPKRPRWVAITKEERDREQQAILDAAIFHNPVRIQPKDAVE